MGFSLAEIREATGGKIAAGAGQKCARVVIDSKRIAPGDAFLAIPGDRFDGHQFIPDAIRAGASAVITAREVEVPAGVGVVVVRDTVAALGALARFHRLHFRLPVVGVTGSTGKTTTKEMIAAIGSVRHRVAKTAGNQNNEIGLPLTLLDLEDGDELLVVEMGMRGAGQISILAELALPDIGVVTNIGLTHLELLGSAEAIAKTKSELLAALPVDGRAVLNADDRYTATLTARSRAPVLTFGLNPQADVRAGNLALQPDGSRFTIAAPGWPEFEVHLPVSGRHHVINALAATAAAYALAYETEEIIAGLGGFGLDRGRGAILRSPEGWDMIDDTYNASPASMEAALKVLASRPGPGRRLAVLADMLELGPATDTEHRRIGAAAAEAGVDVLLTVGDLARAIAEGAVTAGLPSTAARHYAVRAELLQDLRLFLRAGDTVLIKGSRGMHMEEIVAGLLDRT